MDAEAAGPAADDDAVVAEDAAAVSDKLDDGRFAGPGRPREDEAPPADRRRPRRGRRRRRTPGRARARTSWSEGRRARESRPPARNGRVRRAVDVVPGMAVVEDHDPVDRRVGGVRRDHEIDPRRVLAVDGPGGLAEDLAAEIEGRRGRAGRNDG